MKLIILILLCSCSLFKKEPVLNTSPPLPPEAPRESILKPQNDYSAAIDQTKSYYCIKNGDQFNKGVTCEEHSQKIHNNCKEKFKTEDKVLDCLSKLLKI